jgi:3-oxoacyl-[acyl-carrier-protein] synthase II
MCREVAVAFAAANLAVADAQLDSATLVKERFGVVLGSEMFYGHPSELVEIFRNSVRNSEFDIQSFGARIETDMFPLWLLKYLPNMSACHVGIAHQALGANNTIVQGSASALLALAEAVSVIQRGWCDIMLTGGGGTSINPTHEMYITDELHSKQTSSPLCTPRPFDRSRDGAVRGEGACLFVIEAREHAEARGAMPLCEVLGFGRSVGQVSATRYAGASQDAIERSIRWALKNADCAPADIGHVNAEGFGTVEADRREAKAICNELGDTGVTALKSYFGYLAAGSGAVEMAASVLALQHDQVPATLNYREPDPECPVNVIHGATLKARQQTALLLNQSTTGQTVAAVLGKP